MLEALPGAPDCVVIFTPETCPCKACSILVGASSSIVWLETTDTAPVISFLVWVPYPTITTSSRDSWSSSSVITKLFFVLIVTVFSLNPK